MTHVAEQQELDFDAPADDAEHRALGRLVRWREFHRQNPAVYEHFERLVLREIAAGEKRVGQRMVWELIRYRDRVRARRVGADPYALNDHYLKLYCKEFIRRHPDCRSVFEFRRDGN